MNTDATPVLPRFCVYIPSFNNSAPVAESVSSCPPGMPIVVVDNASDAPHRAVLDALAQSRPDVSVVFHKENIGRIPNWTFCVRHFAHHAPGDALWMKWLFAGDVLYPGAIARLQIAVSRYPDARFLVAEHDMTTESGNTAPRTKRWRSLPATQRVSPADALRRAAQNGNWFGPPLAHAIHRNAAQHQSATFGDLPWAADFQFCVDIAASGFSTLYVAETIGAFQQKHRTFYQTNVRSHRAVLEESLVRVHAAREYQRLAENAAEFEELMDAIAAWAEKEATGRVLAHADQSAFAENALTALGLRRVVRLIIKDLRERRKP